ncbi:LacI family DNA-binding transcriptional regulator [Calidithermus timidus]|uniref:LacI family DNA-binding transcriptional regulator n=1 Tax=Calidithermus timidus TaxID=307124 RepID=UPI00037AEEFC|nr:substrate-binding domain-containing protein [Calidithermus timidus]
MPDSVTLSHVAREAGVSPSTVSRVINGTARVAPEKERAVYEAIRRLGYRPNLFAQGLARGKSMSVGVMTQDVASPYYGEVIKGIEQGLDGSPYYPIFASGHWRPEAEREAFKVLSGRKIDALIVMGGLLPDAELLEMAAHLPMVVIGRTVPGLEKDCLHADQVQGAYEATRHLIELGHRRIAHIAGPLYQQDARDRLEGYRKALAEANLNFDPRLVVEGDYHEPSGLMAVEALLSRGALFTAIFSSNDQMAYGARLALYRRGIQVPGEISLVGFDDLPISSYTTPPLTTVAQPTLEFGREAARAILAKLEGRPYSLPALANKLIIRESTALLRQGAR